MPGKGEEVPALVIGAGPAGLMAAEALAGAGHRVLVVDRMPSVARKLLMAGKSGLNLTRDRPDAEVLAAYGEAAPWLGPMIAAFGPDAVQGWARGLGQTLFTGSTGRVFPEVMKASPLLRAWLARLTGQGVEIRTRWRWHGWGAEGAALFETPDGPARVMAGVTVLAAGGASWPRLGSDGAWAEWLGPVTPFAPSNCGFRVSWSDHMAPHFGQPVKAVALRAGDAVSRGEFVISRSGVEGGAIYALSAALREGASLEIDLFPDLSVAAVAARLARVRKGESMANRLRRLKLDPARRALVMELARPLPQGEALAARLKALPLPLEGPQGLDRAISTAGGLRRAALHGDLMLRDRPGVFAAGEMLDWDAPTGGYLLTACLATGLWAGRAAARRLEAAGRRGA